MVNDNQILFEAGQVAASSWNGAHRFKVAIGVKAVEQIGNKIVVDGTIHFYEKGDCLDGQFTVGNVRDWDDLISFVYGWLECIEESYHLVYE